MQWVEMQCQQLRLLLPFAWAQLQMKLQQNWQGNAMHTCCTTLIFCWVAGDLSSPAAELLC
jgi:hypothetical protein